ncbi:MAG: hypothetical protein C4323_08650 [Mastigocladus sp. ERB_26_2]
MVVEIMGRTSGHLALREITNYRYGQLIYYLGHTDVWLYEGRCYQSPEFNSRKRQFGLSLSVHSYVE